MIISHRGNLHGPDSTLENSINQINTCLEMGFDVEIDVRYWDNKILLGHDNGETEIPVEWIEDRADKLWIHCKNLQALRFFYNTNFNYFWHQEDDFTLTSQNIIWVYPRKEVTDKSVIVCQTTQECEDYINSNALGMCSDYVGTYR